MNRRHFLSLMNRSSAAAAVAWSLSNRCRPGGQSKPNIIFILADDLGYGDLGCYGQERIKTPHLDQMADEGIRFTDHYAGSTVCAPSRCCLMTGMHTGHSRIRGNSLLPLLAEDATVAEYLQKAGYATALIGKWGLGEENSSGIPTRKGFDYFFGYLNQRHAHNYYPAFLWRNEQKVTLQNIVQPAPTGDANELSGYASTRLQYSPDLFTEEALAFVEKNSSRPFFLYWSPTIPHANNEARFFNHHGLEVPALGTYQSESWPEAQKGLAAMITRLDGDIGRMLQKLQDLGLSERTIVFFSSDNGPHREGGNDPDFFDSNGPWRGIKRDLYEGGIRVPLIVRWPDHIMPGISHEPCAFWDFLPTCCDLAGVKMPAHVDGLSLVPLLLAQKPIRHEQFYWEFHEGPSSKQAVRRGSWKGIRHRPAGPLELYDLTLDPGEKNDVAVNHPEVIRILTEYLDGARTENPQWPLKDAEVR